LKFADFLVTAGRNVKINIIPAHKIVIAELAPPRIVNGLLKSKDKA
jgi:hypothetical protein